MKCLLDDHSRRATVGTASIQIHRGAVPCPTGLTQPVLSYVTYTLFVDQRIKVCKFGHTIPVHRVIYTGTGVFLSPPPPSSSSPVNQNNRVTHFLLVDPGVLHSIHSWCDFKVRVVLRGSGLRSADLIILGTFDVDFLVVQSLLHASHLGIFDFLSLTP